MARGTGAGARGPGGGGGPGPGARGSCGSGRGGGALGGNRDGRGPDGLLLCGARVLAASVGGWAGAGAGQGWARRQEPRPGWIRDRRRVDGEGRGGRDLKGPHHPLPLGAPRGGGVGGQRPGSQWAGLGTTERAWNRAP